MDENSAMVLDIQSKEIENARRGNGQVAISDHRAAEFRQAPSFDLNDRGYARDGSILSFDQESQSVQINTFDNGTENIDDDIELCGVKMKKVDAGDVMGRSNNERGGNIMGFPGGGCLVGDQMDMEFARSICGEGQPLIRVSTEGTRVNHVDENINIVPNFNRAEPCNFSIVMASAPAMNEILRQYPDEPFFGPTNMPTGFRYNEDSDLVCNSINALNYAEAIDAYHQQFPSNQETQPTIRVRQTVLEFLETLILARASAQTPLNDDECGDKKIRRGVNLWNFPGRAPETFREQCEADEFAQTYINLAPPPVDCKTITNRDVLRILELDEARLLDIANRMPQTTPTGLGVEKISRLVTGITSALDYQKRQHRMTEVMESNKSILQSHLPASCQSENMFIELPVVFSSNGNTNPNPANLLVVNKTAIIPQQINNRVSEKIRQSFEAIGLDTKEVYTLTRHIGGGNIHCLSNEVRICRP